jgi:hypothetical protein
MIRLAADLDACLVHCGARPAVEDPTGDVMKARESLARRNALFETGTYLPSYGVAREFLRASPCSILPYRRHYVSSGVMLQALDAGRPVLVPDRGLMAWRTQRFGLGRTYAEGSCDDLRQAAVKSLSEAPEAYAPRLGGFMEYFARDRVVSAVRHALDLGGPPAATPYDVDAASGRT